MLDLDAVTHHAGRAAPSLTRRDVARALLSVPASQALDALPGLRRDLTRAANSLSAPFWAAAEAVLTRIRDELATRGDVDRFLQATGTEPARMVWMTVWEDEEERSPTEAEMHGLLVAQLEEHLAAGDIDPDRLAAGDEAHWAAWLELQERWLRTPLPDGRTPMWAVENEKDEEFVAAWDEAEASARKDLSAALAAIGGRPCPAGALRSACHRLRTGLREGGWHYDTLAAAGGLSGEETYLGSPESIPDDDEELWLRLAAGIVSPQEEPPDTDIVDIAAWYSISHEDWYEAILALARGGPGTPADADSVARAVVAASRKAVEATGGNGDEAPWEGDGDDDTVVLTGGFLTVVELWRVVGAIDADDRLTSLGWWGLPNALLRAWAPKQP